MANLLAAKASSFSAKALTIRARPLISGARVMVVHPFDHGEAMAMAVHLSQLTTRNAMLITGRCMCFLQGFEMAALHSLYHLHVQEFFDEERSLHKCVQVPSG